MKIKATPHHSSCTKFGPLSFFPSKDINSRDQHFWCNSFYVEQYRVCSHKHSRTQTTRGKFSSHSSRSFPASSPASGAAPRTAAPLRCLFPTCCVPPSPPELSLIHPHIFLSQNNTQTKPGFPQYSNSWAAFVLGGNMCLAAYCGITNEGQFSARHNPACSTPVCWDATFRPLPRALLLNASYHMFTQY